MGVPLKKCSCCIKFVILENSCNLYLYATAVISNEMSVHITEGAVHHEKQVNIVLKKLFNDMV